MAFRNQMRSYGRRFKQSFRRPQFRRSFRSYNPMRGKKSSFMTIGIVLVGAFLLKDKIPFIGKLMDQLTGKGK